MRTTLFRPRIVEVATRRELPAGLMSARRSRVSSWSRSVQVLDRLVPRLAAAIDGDPATAVGS